MKPNGQKKATDTERNFAYRLPHFRRISENTFGIWSKRFSAKAQLTPKKAALNIMASIALHNTLRTKSSESYTPHGSVDNETKGTAIEGTWCECSTPNLAFLQNENIGRQSLVAKKIRQKYCDYFNGSGHVTWQ